MWPLNFSFIPSTHPTPALLSSQLSSYTQILSSSSAPCPCQSPSTDSSCHTNLSEHKLQLRGLVGWIHRYLRSQKQKSDHLLALNTLLLSTDSNRKVPPGLSHPQSLSSNTELKTHDCRDSTFTENIPEFCACMKENNWKRDLCEVRQSKQSLRNRKQTSCLTGVDLVDPIH